MYSSMKAELAARDGDLRLCLLLGIAAWFLFLDHVPHNVVSQLTMRNLDINDTRAKLKLYSDTGLLSSGDGSEIFKLGNDKSDEG